MATTKRQRLALVFTALGFALGGCAMMEGSGGPASPASPTASMGSGGSPFVRAGMEPFSLGNCLKFEAVPQECERAILQGQ